MKFVARALLDQTIYWHTKELTIMTNLINAMFVRNDFRRQAIYRDTKELTQETNLMNVMFVTRGFPQHFHDE